MNYFELLKVNRQFLHICKNNGVIVSDVEMLDIYDQYLQLKASGAKKLYVMEKCASDAGITTRTLYSIIQRMERKINI